MSTYLIFGRSFHIKSHQMFKAKGARESSGFTGSANWDMGRIATDKAVTSAAASAASQVASDHAGVHQLKYMIIGDAGSGKTALVIRFCRGLFVQTHDCTVGIDVGFKTLVLPNGQIAKLQLWDTAGQERYHSITTNYYRGAQGIIIVYDINKQQAQHNIRLWLLEVRKHCDGDDIPIIVIGTKADLRKEPAGSSGTDPLRESSGTVTPRESSGIDTLRESSGTVTPRESSGTFAPREPSGTDTLRESSGTATPRESSGTVTPRESSGTGTPREQPNAWKDELNIFGVFEASAKTGQGVHQAFLALTEELVSRRLSELNAFRKNQSLSLSRRVLTDERKYSKGKCC